MKFVNIGMGGVVIVDAVWLLWCAHSVLCPRLCPCRV